MPYEDEDPPGNYGFSAPLLGGWFPEKGGRMSGTAEGELIPRDKPGFGQRLKFAVKVNHTVFALTVPFGIQVVFEDPDPQFTVPPDPPFVE